MIHDIKTILNELEKNKVVEGRDNHIELISTKFIKDQI